MEVQLLMLLLHNKLRKKYNFFLKKCLKEIEKYVEIFWKLAFLKILFGNQTTSGTALIEIALTGESLYSAEFQRLCFFKQIEHF